MERDEFQRELEYLDRAEEIIRHKLERLRAAKAPLRDQILQERKAMWEDNRHLVRDIDDVIFLNTQEAVVERLEKQFEWNEIEIQRQTKMEESPYFGRVDFEEGETGESGTIYIGIYSLTEEETHEIYVVDWRAPIASMFYQFDLGPAWYEVNGHRTEVEMTRKRQYKIQEGRLLAAYDTDSSMYDDILGEVLSEHSDHKLKVIIGSIQKEQNLAIRSDTRRSCLIYGLAGSGKTSIGLHRLAYILYCNKDEIKSENILILSNNNIFSSYISTILPDLGEKAAETKVFSDLLEEKLEKGMKIEGYYTQLKRIEDWSFGDRLKWLQVKYSPELLRYCIDFFDSFSFQIPEVRYGDEVIVSPGVLQRKWKTGEFLSFPASLERLNHLVRKAIEDYFLLHKEEMKEEIYDDGMENQGERLSEKHVNALYKRKMLEVVDAAREEVIRKNSLDPKELMIQMFTRYQGQTEEGKEEAERLSDSLERGKLWYEDALLYLFVKVLMGKVATITNIRHIVIDEVQDYNLVQLYIMKYLFPKATFTLLGDIYQTVNSLTTIQRYDDFAKVFGDGLMGIRLSKCYRSSSDINALAFSLIDERERPIAEEYSYFQRTAGKPRYVICEDLFSCLAPVLERLEKHHSVAVIVNSDEEALEVKSYLEKYRRAQMIISPEDELEDGIVIIPLLLAKGLEFDAVVLFGCIYANEKNPHLRRRVYLGCTRALHELYFVEKNPLPESLQDCRAYVETEDWGRQNEERQALEGMVQEQ